MKYDVITFGETMLRLSPPGMSRISQATQFEVQIGGSESNTAVGLSRLGLKVAWLSKLTNNPMGHMIVEGISAHGVDTSHVVWTDQDRVGTYYWERGTKPRGSRVIYDRKGSAISRMQAVELPQNLFESSMARLFHTTGITLGISETAAETAITAATLARNAGLLVSFDLNYRSKLWSPQAARSGCEPLMQIANIVFMPQRDAISIWGCLELVPEKQLGELAKLFPHAAIVLTMGAQGAAVRSSDGQFVYERAFEVEEVERLGGGDAFSAGFLYGYVTTQDLALALRWGNATAALKYTIPAEFPLIERREVEALVQGGPHAKVDR